jgi:hypothetical protein
MRKKPAKVHTKKKNAYETLTLKLTFIILGSFLVFVFSFALFLTRSHASQQTCANSISCIKDLSGKPQSDTQGVFMGRKVQSPTIPDTPSFEIAQAQSVLGSSTSNNKHIYVDLGKQQLTAYDGGTLFMSVPISSGKWHPTPTGDFHIWIWLVATRMTGGDPAKGTFYDLPNVPFTMYFYNAQTPKAWGYSLHGAYWHNNFGHPMSHGCVNMRPDDAKQLFYWSNSAIHGWTTYATSDNPGPTITIFGAPPAGETSFVD